MEPMGDSCDEIRRLRAAPEPSERQRLLGSFFMRHRERLKRMVALRMDGRLQRRIDPSDVLQDAFLEAAQRLEAYLENASVPFFIWLRFLTGQKLIALHRHHLGTQARDARREVYLFRGTMPQATSEALAAQLLGEGASPSETAMQAERKIRLQEALNSMDPLDRELVALRHFERLSGAEAARVLGIEDAAGRQRYVRALRKLKSILESMPGGMG